MTETQILIGFIGFLAVYMPVVALMVRGLKPVNPDCKNGHDWNLLQTQCLVCEHKAPVVNLSRERAIRNSPFGPIRSKVVEPKR